jgi:hypothetical protein
MSTSSDQHFFSLSSLFPIGSNKNDKQSDNKSDKDSNKDNKSDKDSDIEDLYYFDVVFDPNPQNKLGGLILSFRNDIKAVVISGFETLASSLNGRIQIGDEIIQANSTNLEGINGDSVLAIIKGLTWPVKIKFRRRYYRPTSTPTYSGSSSPKLPTSLLFDQSENLEENGKTITKLTEDISKSIHIMRKHHRIKDEVILTPGLLDRVPNIHIRLAALCDDVMTSLNRLENLEQEVAKIKLNKRSSTHNRIQDDSNDNDKQVSNRPI